MNKVLTLYDKSAWVINTTWRIWGNRGDKLSLFGIRNIGDLNLESHPVYSINEDSTNAKTPFTPFSVSEADLNLYLDKFMVTLNDISETTTDAINQRVFGSTENDDIKLNIYRTLKAIYDKWIGGVGSLNQVIFQGGTGRLDNDKKFAISRGRNEPALIDSYRFVTRSFEDIGDKFYINLTRMRDLMVGDKASESVYSIITRLLSDNNFDFIALPSYVDYNKVEEVESIFRPYTYAESANLASVGPSFVCVYVGQGSTKLDFDDDGDSEYPHPNDGFDFSETGPMPKDFDVRPNQFEDMGVAFKVNYGHQNQNIFKDLNLDQSEFTETAESLKIIDEIAKGPSSGNKTYIGQNLYNVWSVRSYKAGIEMLGDAMIQPMMYFQLDNIPMFHGGYLITRVKHKIVPNNMVTTFSGVRTKYTATPLITAYDFYMSMVESIDTSSAGTGPVNLPKSVPPIIETIIENGGMPSNIVQGNIKMSALGKVSGINNVVPKSNNLLLSEAIAPLSEMLNEWVKWMKSVGFSGSKDNKEIFANITSMYRTNEDQIRIRKEYPKSASAGVSNHQWGIALDFQFYKKNGDLIPNKPNIFVAPNGFGKSSFTTAFKVLNKNKINLTEKEDFYKNDDKNNSRAEIKIIVEDASGRDNELIATNTKNEINKRVKN
jgi:hypothetical protein